MANHILHLNKPSEVFEKCVLSIPVTFRRYWNVFMNRMWWWCVIIDFTLIGSNCLGIQIDKNISYLFNFWLVTLPMRFHIFKEKLETWWKSVHLTNYTSWMSNERFHFDEIINLLSLLWMVCLNKHVGSQNATESPR